MRRAFAITPIGCAALLCVTRAGAQLPGYADVTETHLPGGLAGQCMDAGAGDADGDGDLDLALAMEFQTNILLLNDGTGRFSDASRGLPRTEHDSEDIEFGDFDADGDLDLVVVSEDDEVNELYLNRGDGTFADASDRIAVGGVSNAHAVMDLNGDGALDILIGNNGVDRVLLNDGQGRFSDASARAWVNDAATQDLEAADVDGDGDLDVVVANEGQNQLFLNDGSGTLVDATREHLPLRDDETREIKAADLDGDGDLDLVVANVQFVLRAPRRDYLLLNDGSGVFTDAPGERLPDGDRDHFTVQVVDLEGDGDVDILAPLTRLRGTPGDYRVLLNDGAGAFSVAPPGSVLPSSAGGNGFDIEVADFDGDGSADLFLCNRASSRAPGAAAAAGGQPRLLLRRAGQ